MTVMFVTYLYLFEDIIFYEIFPIDNSQPYTYFFLEDGKIVKRYGCFAEQPHSFLPLRFNIVTILVLLRIG